MILRRSLGSSGGLQGSLGPIFKAHGGQFFFSSLFYNYNDDKITEEEVDAVILSYEQLKQNVKDLEQ